MRFENNSFCVGWIVGYFNWFESIDKELEVLDLNLNKVEILIFFSWWLKFKPPTLGIDFQLV